MKSFTFYLALCTALLLNGNLYSQVTINGKVSDLQTEETLDNTRVSTESGKYFTYTNSNGEFELETGSKPSKLVFYRIGYAPLEVNYDSKIHFYNILLSPTNIMTNEVKVIGYGNNKTLLETPSSIGLITRDDLIRTSGVKLSQSFNNLTGVKMETRNSLSSERIIIRGVGARSNFNIRGLKVYLNDIPMTDASGNTNTYGWDGVTLGGIEVLKGPSSSLYGANIGGVINMTTERTRYGDRSFKLSGLYGTDGLNRYSGALRFGMNRANILLNYSRQRYDGYREHSSDAKDFVTFLGQFYPGDDNTITVFGNYNKVDFRIPGSVDSLMFVNDPRKADPNSVQKNTGYKADQLRIGVSQLYNFSPLVSNTSSIYVFGTYFDHPLTFAYLRSSELSYGGRTSFTFNPVMGNLNPKFIVGGEYIYNFSSDKNYVNNNGTEGAIQSDKELNYHTYSLFAQSDFNIFKNTFLTLGLSFSNFKYDVLDLFKANGVDQTGSRKFDPSVSPRIALLHKLGENIAVHSSVSFGFSPPSVFEVFNNNGTVNTEIEAEKGINFEVGSKGNLFDNRLNYDVSIYNLNLKDELIQKFIAQDLSVFVNAGKTRHTGLELYVSYDLTPERTGVFSIIRPFVAYTYNDFKFTEYSVDGKDYSGNKLTGIPDNLLNAGIDIGTKFGANLYVTYQFVDKYPIVDNNSRYSEAYSLLNAKVSFNRALSNLISLEVYGGVDNILNENYSSFIMLNQQAFGPPGTLPKFYNPSPMASYYTGLNLKYNF